MSRTVTATALTGVRSLAILLLGGSLLAAPAMAREHGDGDDDGRDDEGDTIHRTRPHPRRPLQSPSLHFCMIIYDRSLTVLPGHDITNFV